MTAEHINYVLGGKSGHRRAGWSVTPTRREAGKVPQKIYRRALYCTIKCSGKGEKVV